MYVHDIRSSGTKSKMKKTNTRYKKKSENHAKIVQKLIW